MSLLEHLYPEGYREWRGGLGTQYLVGYRRWLDDILITWNDQVIDLFNQVWLKGEGFSEERKIRLVTWEPLSTSAFDNPSTNHKNAGSMSTGRSGKGILRMNWMNNWVTNRPMVVTAWLWFDHNLMTLKDREKIVQKMIHDMLEWKKQLEQEKTRMILCCVAKAMDPFGLSAMEEVCQEIRKTLGLTANSQCFFVGWVEDTTARKVLFEQSKSIENAALEQIYQSYKLRLDALKKKRDQPEIANIPIYLVHYDWKMAFLSEYRQDRKLANRYYQLAYEEITVDIAEGYRHRNAVLMDSAQYLQSYYTAIIQKFICAEILLYKSCQTEILKDPEVGKEISVARYSKHMNFFAHLLNEDDSLLGYPHAFVLWAWLSKQYLETAALYERFDIDTSDIAWLILLSVDYANNRANSFAIAQETLYHINPTIGPNNSNLINYVGEILDEGLSFMLNFEKSFNHSRSAIEELTKVFKMFKQIGLDRAALHVTYRIGLEYLAGGNEEMALSVLESVRINFKKERWWPLYRDIAHACLRCATKLGNIETLVSCSISLLGSFCRLSLGEAEVVYQQLIDGLSVNNIIQKELQIDSNVETMICFYAHFQCQIFYLQDSILLYIMVANQSNLQFTLSQIQFDIEGIGANFFISHRVANNEPKFDQSLSELEYNGNTEDWTSLDLYPQTIKIIQVRLPAKEIGKLKCKSIKGCVQFYGTTLKFITSLSEKVPEHVLFLMRRSLLQYLPHLPSVFNVECDVCERKPKILFIYIPEFTPIAINEPVSFTIKLKNNDEIPLQVTIELIIYHESIEGAALWNDLDKISFIIDAGKDEMHTMHGSFKSIEDAKKFHARISYFAIIPGSQKKATREYSDMVSIPVEVYSPIFTKVNILSVELIPLQDRKNEAFSIEDQCNSIGWIESTLRERYVVAVMASIVNEHIQVKNIKLTMPQQNRDPEHGILSMEIKAIKLMDGNDLAWTMEIEVIFNPTLRLTTQLIDVLIIESEINHLLHHTYFAIKLPVAPFPFCQDPIRLSQEVSESPQADQLFTVVYTVWNVSTQERTICTLVDTSEHFLFSGYKKLVSHALLPYSYRHFSYQIYPLSSGCFCLPHFRVYIDQTEITSTFTLPFRSIFIQPSKLLKQTQ